ncbi:MAG: ComF family protein [Anaerolineales bacterium]|nr:ComF family protein [Anaerolineales bacterium]MDW8447371.1 ComF family protein [Anaerolineales bacterium]
MSIFDRSSVYPYTLYRGFWKFLDWVYPPSCAGCGRTGVRWCSDCQGSVQRITGELCDRCGLPLPTSAACPTCADRAFILDGLRGYGRYSGPLRNVIHRLKYHRDVSLAETLSLRLIELFLETNWVCDLVVPVPLGVVRRRERGYNQAALIAYPLALAVRIPYSGRALQRVRETSSQVDLGLSQRLENVRDAFWADASSVKGKSVLVVDDVMTTGATINECAKALKEAGARAVFGLVVARTILT